MLILVNIDRTEDRPVTEYLMFRNEDELREATSDDYRWEEGEIDQLIETGILDKDKRSVHQLLTFLDGEEQGETIECKECECALNYCCCDQKCSRCNEAPTHCTCDPIPLSIRDKAKAHADYLRQRATDHFEPDVPESVDMLFDDAVDFDKMAMYIENDRLDLAFKLFDNLDTDPREDLYGELTEEERTALESWGSES